MTIRNIPICHIHHEGLQLRAKGTDLDVVADYQEVLRRGGALAPVLVFQEAPNLFHLADGHHTFAAYAGEGRTEIPAEVRQGNHRAALLAAAGANGSHGLR